MQLDLKSELKFTMAQFNPMEIVYHNRNGTRAYYSHNEELYGGTFPEEWAENHAEGTGPKECRNCNDFGSWNGVFIGYCANCAYVYNGTRGRGLMGLGKENDDPSVLEYPSIYSTYLKDVDPCDVGDTDFMDSADVVNYAFEIDESGNVVDSSGNPIENLLVPTSDKPDSCPEINWDEVNAYADSIAADEPYDEVSYSIDRHGSYGSNYDGGYDSY